MTSSPAADWLRPHWPAPARVQALCTTRSRGESRPPYDSLNLGDHVGDAPEAVAANRAFLADVLGARPVFLQQVHGQHLVHLPAVGDEVIPGLQADACLTRQTGVACTILVADCLPVLFTDRRGRFVAAVHAGWRGLAGGVLEAVVAELLANDDTTVDELLVWLGPCIGPQAFEVGDDVRAAFVTHDPALQRCLRPAAMPGKWLADLPALARQRLAALGLVQPVYGNDGSLDWCTVSQPSRFFSHRRDGVSGRMAACIWLT